MENSELTESQASHVLLTGAFGFLGREIHNALAPRHPVTTVGLNAKNTLSVDLARSVPTLSKPYDLVIHSAGMAHIVPKTKHEVQKFYEVNVKGTENLLAGLSENIAYPKRFVFISTIAVYGLIAGENITEDYPLYASDPYGRSKIAAEMLVDHWCKKHDVELTILRLPLVAGANPPGNLGKMIKALREGTYLNIGGGVARKSIVMASDVARLLKGPLQPGIYHLTDGSHPSLNSLERLMTSQLRKGEPMSIPLWTAKLLGKAGDALNLVRPGSALVNSSVIEKLTATLTFDDSRARRLLRWKPNKVIDVFRIQ